MSQHLSILTINICKDVLTAKYTYTRKLDLSKTVKIWLAAFFQAIQGTYF